VNPQPMQRAARGEGRERAERLLACTVDHEIAQAEDAIVADRMADEIKRSRLGRRIEPLELVDERCAATDDQGVIEDAQDGVELGVALGGQDVEVRLRDQACEALGTFG